MTGALKGAGRGPWGDYEAQLGVTIKVKWKAGALPLAEEVGFAFPEPFHPPDVRPAPDHRVGGLVHSWPLVRDGGVRSSDTIGEKAKLSAADGTSPRHSL